MAEPFLSEIRLFSFNFAPQGWATCNGQSLPINQNQALFSLLGTTYGGNGQTTFNLPNLQGRSPIHMGSGYTLGEAGGEENHTLTLSELPSHTHPASGSTDAATLVAPAGNVLASATGLYATDATTTALAPGSIGAMGGGQAHQNRQPYLTMNYCIALQGIFPSQN